MNQNEKQNIEIAILKTKLTGVEKSVDKIMNNHLPHIQTAINEHIKEAGKRFNTIEKKIAYWTGSVGIVIVLLEIIIKKYF